MVGTTSLALFFAKTLVYFTYMNLMWIFYSACKHLDVANLKAMALSFSSVWCLVKCIGCLFPRFWNRVLSVWGSIQRTPCLMHTTFSNFTKNFPLAGKEASGRHAEVNKGTAKKLSSFLACYIMKLHLNLSYSLWLQHLDSVSCICRIYRWVPVCTFFVHFPRLHYSAVESCD